MLEGKKCPVVADRAKLFRSNEVPELKLWLGNPFKEALL